MLFDPHRQWAPRGICRWEDRELFFADAGQPNRRPSKAVQAKWNQAKEICAMCPAKAECERDTLGEQYGVFGGRDQYQRFQIRMQMPKAVKAWPKERQLTWGRELHSLREHGLSWQKIQDQCGLPLGASEYLVKTWVAHLEERRKNRRTQAEIVDLPLPESRNAFPDRHGRRHAWVRNNGLFSDAWYRGETADGEWINLTTFSGRGQVHKWFPKTDVRIYRPQAVVIMSYAKAA
ncbi:WhiB family transcriptional regulator [Streptomyces sp. NPDC002928]|uniref:WhiB family transcriptional regulator n=1 Tax=Streptomyces sp. NPDC002928 TaxID=3154440 RepID=UPI0033B8C5A1